MAQDLCGDKFTLEVCIDNLDSAKAAIDGGADRLEVCSALALGGLTPSMGLLTSIKAYLESKGRKDVHLAVMIRSRSGDFVYSDDEIRVMQSEISHFRDSCDSFVFGCLRITDLGVITLHREHCQTLLAACGNRSATFHRAIDVCPNPIETCSELVKLGFKRVLTSGGAAIAPDGINTIKKLQNTFGRELTIMAGSGVKATNIPLIYQATGVHNYHSSCSTEHTSPIDSICRQIFPAGVSSWQITDQNKVSEIRKLIDKLK